jgi:hypothetical protein
MKGGVTLCLEETKTEPVDRAAEKERARVARTRAPVREKVWAASPAAVEAGARAKTAAGKADVTTDKIKTP